MNTCRHQSTEWDLDMVVGKCMECGKVFRAAPGEGMIVTQTMGQYRIGRSCIRLITTNSAASPRNS